MTWREQEDYCSEKKEIKINSAKGNKGHKEIRDIKVHACVWGKEDVYETAAKMYLLW